MNERVAMRVSLNDCFSALSMYAAQHLDMFCVDIVRIGYPGDGDLEDMILGQLKLHVDTTNKCTYMKKKIRNEYILPFLPPLSISLVEEAIYYREDKQQPFFCYQCDGREYPTKIYSRNDDWKLDLNHELDYKRRPGQRAVALTAIESVNMSADTFHRLKHGKYVNDEAVNRFGCLFNAHEREKLAENPKYEPAIMLQTWFTDAIKRGERGKDELWKWFSFSERKNGLKGGRDIFSGISKLYCPYNIDNQHWVLFVVDSNSLEQKLYDSLWEPLNSDTSFISSGIHHFLLDYHLATMGKEHPNMRTWTRASVTSNHCILGNACQSAGGMDCALHTCINAVLLQEGVPLYLLSDEKDKVSNEMRVRMTLTVARNQWFFEVDFNKMNKMRRDTTGAPVDVGRTQLTKVRKLNAAIVVQRKKRKNENKSAD